MNQLWNWVKGEGESWERERAPRVYWSAWAEVRAPAGATAKGGVVSWGGFAGGGGDGVRYRSVLRRGVGRSLLSGGSGGAGV